MVAFGVVAMLLILALLQPPPYIPSHEASSNGFLARLALLLSSKLSLGCGGAVVPPVDSSMIPQTTHMRALTGGVTRLLAHGAEIAKEAIHRLHYLVHQEGNGTCGKWLYFDFSWTSSTKRRML
jgi:hypothetical protein